MIKKILKTAICVLICIVVCIGIPFIAEKIVVDGICGYTANTYLGNDTWFSFYGSYLGAIIAVGIFFLTLRNDKKQIINEIKNQKVKEKYSSEKETAKEIVSLLALDKFYSDPCEEISFSSTKVLKNDIRRVGLLVTLLDNEEFITKVEECAQKYKETVNNEIDEQKTTLIELRVILDNLKDYYSKSGIDDAYLEFLEETEKRELQELTRG